MTSIRESTWKSQVSRSNSKHTYILSYNIINKNVCKDKTYDMIIEIRLLIYKMKVFFWRTTFHSGLIKEYVLKIQGYYADEVRNWFPDSPGIYFVYRGVL